MVPQTSTTTTTTRSFVVPSPMRLLRYIAYTRLCTRYALSASWDTQAGGGDDEILASWIEYDMERKTEDLEYPVTRQLLDF